MRYERFEDRGNGMRKTRVNGLGKQSGWWASFKAPRGVTNLKSKLNRPGRVYLGLAAGKIKLNSAETKVRRFLSAEASQWKNREDLEQCDEVTSFG